MKNNCHLLKPNINSFPTRFVPLERNKLNMEYQRFMPEGWQTEKVNFTLEELEQAQKQGTVIQGLVEQCDANCNLQIQLGNDIIGTIPRNEFDVLHQDDFGMTRPSICKNKVNQFVQFKVKEIYDENCLLLSRKEARKRSTKLGERRFKTRDDCESEW